MNAKIWLQTCIPNKPQIFAYWKNGWLPLWTYYQECILFNISHWRGNVRLSDDSSSRRRTLNALRMNLNLIDVRGGQSAHDNKSHIHTPQAERTWRLMGGLWHSVCIEAARRTLPRGHGLSPISRKMIELASCFGYIIVKCQPMYTEI